MRTLSSIIASIGISLSSIIASIGISLSSIIAPICISSSQYDPYDKTWILDINSLPQRTCSNIR